MKNHSPKVKTIFLFGKENPEIENEMIQKEQSEFCDLVQMDYIDSYSNVTLDTVMALKFVSSLEKSKNLEYLFIADDDTYVHVNGLLKIVQNPSQFGAKTKMIGFPIGGSAAIVHYPEADKFKNNEILPIVDWTYTPKYLFDEEQFPTFLSGGGYLLPMSHIPCLYQVQHPC